MHYNLNSNNEIRPCVNAYYTSKCPRAGVRITECVRYRRRGCVAYVSSCAHICFKFRPANAVPCDVHAFPCVISDGFSGIRRPRYPVPLAPCGSTSRFIPFGADAFGPNSVPAAETLALKTEKNGRWSAVSIRSILGLRV